MGFGLQKFDLSTITRRLELHEISIDKTNPLTLIVAYCGAGNSRWESLMFRRAAAAKEKEKAAAKATEDAANAPTTAPTSEAVQPDTVAEPQSADADMNAIVVDVSIVGWEQVYDDAQPDSPATCTRESALRFIAEIRERCPDVWRRVLAYILNVGNFRGDALDSAALGKK